jgi:hypothetical protein
LCNNFYLNVNFSKEHNNINFGIFFCTLFFHCRLMLEVHLILLSLLHSVICL